MRWIINNQLGRRNLEPLQRDNLIGRRFELEKRQGERTDLTSRENPEKLTTAERIGNEYGVSPETVAANGQFVQGLDELKKVREDLPTSILTTPLAARRPDQRGAWGPPHRGGRDRRMTRL